MIVAQRKKIPEIMDIIKRHKKVLVLGCGTCVTVCLAGGEREVGIMASALRIASRQRSCSFTRMRRRSPGNSRTIQSETGLRGT
ncbi:MAG: hypothetical protein P8016_08835 [Sedimentisphaerales bacterium]